MLQRPRRAVLLTVGQAGGRQAISLERVAINVDDARIADNAGAQPIDTPVARNGPIAYFTSLPIKAMLLALQGEGVAAEVSQSAGTFVCNHVFYALMHQLATGRGLKKMRGGFVHVPYLPEQGTPCMPMDEMVRGLRVALRCALSRSVDTVHSAGAVS